MTLFEDDLMNEFQTSGLEITWNRFHESGEASGVKQGFV